MVDAPWARPATLDTLLDEWLAAGELSPFAAHHCQPSKPATFAALPTGLRAGLVTALARRGIEQLYSHQRQAVDAALERRHVVIATPTASGKSLCFHLPVLETLARDPHATALFLYPTKALSRDQEHALLSTIAEAELDLGAVVFDGDTPGDARKAARERGRIILSNPDMVHSGILPNHARWASFFQGLRYVVLDELHTYRGVFGSHMAHVIARLRRLAAFHGASPTFICATATIGNPAAHAAKLLGLREDELETVCESGAPNGPREFFLYNPPVVNAELQIRRSALKEAVRLGAELVRAKVPTLLFGPSRNSVEVMLKYLRAACRDTVAPDAIMGYRGGYLPDQRRRIERDLREGRILAVVATNALELGIDIGDLDAVICAGYPGSIAGTWQRFGRAGRRGGRSVALLVCTSDPMDQYLAQHPDSFLTARAEEARIDPSNVEILLQHLKCATFEAPFHLTGAGDRPAHPLAAEGESYLTLDPVETRAALTHLAKAGLVHERGDRFYWAGEAFPASSVSLRSIGWDNFVIIDLESNRTIGELDWRAAHTMLHEQAIYQQDAEQYQVERLDYDNHKAYVRRVEPDYFTTALTYRTVEVLEEEAAGHLGVASFGAGLVKVVEKVTGYKKVKFFTHENAGYGDVHLPEMQMHTTAFWLTLPDAATASLHWDRGRLLLSFRAVGNALHTVAAVSLMCDRRDLGRSLGNGEETTDGSPLPPGRNPLAGRVGDFAPTAFIFDAIPGGVGLAPRIMERRLELLAAARAMLASCQCRSGCPACVGALDAAGAARSDAVVLLDLFLAGSGTVP